MKNRRRFFWLAIPLMLAGLTGVVMLLWNAILPDLFQVNRISYFQALGLLVLCRILLGGFRFGGRSSFGGPSSYRRGKPLSDEDRQRIKEEWRRRCQRRGTD